MLKTILAAVGLFTIVFASIITTWYCIFDKMPEESKGEEKDAEK